MRYLSHNSFARTTLRKLTVAVRPDRTCDWCGQARKDSRLYSYLTEDDGGRVHTHKGLFCSKSCHAAYHGG